MKKQLLSVVSFVMAILVFTTCLSIANASDTNILGIISQTLSAISGTNTDAPGTNTDAVGTESDAPATDSDAPGTDSDAETTTLIYIPTSTFSTEPEQTTAKRPTTTHLPITTSPVTTDSVSVPESSSLITTVPSSIEPSENSETTNANEPSRSYTTTIPYQELSIYDLFDKIAVMVGSSSDISADDMVEICNIIANLKEGISTNSLSKEEIYEKLDQIVELYPDASVWTVHIKRRISETELGQLTTVPVFVPATVPSTTVPSTTVPATTAPHTTVPSATVPSTNNTNVTLPTLPNITLPDETAVTRVPGQTVVDDGGETTKVPVTVDTDIPSTGGGNASVLARILEFFRDLFIRFIEFLITVTETLADAIEALGSLIK